MKWFDKTAILGAIDDDAAMTAIERAFQIHSRGDVQSIAVGHLRFDRPPGDFHVKGAHIDGSPLFAIKMASNFFDNPTIGLPSSNGMMLVFDAATGTPLGTLLDEGELTDLRTAIAGAIAARLIAPSRPSVLGVIGAGTQAGLQARWIARTLGIDNVRIWARDPARAISLAHKLGTAGHLARTDTSIADLCRDADIIVTTTASREALIGPEHLRPGLRIVAIGADASGKREVASEIIEAADVLLTDSTRQCLAYGECHGLTNTGKIEEMGAVLARTRSLDLPRDSIAVADLTGIGVQDAAIAELAWKGLHRSNEDA